MDKELLIEEAWLSYRNAVIPAAAGATQLIETRRAFYAGACGLLQTVLKILEPGQEATAADVRTVGLIAAELRRFNDAVKAGLA
jgi:hypothetical protein